MGPASSAVRDDPDNRRFSAAQVRVVWLLWANVLFGFGTGLYFIVSRCSAGQFGWRGAHYVPAAILAAMGIVTMSFLREDPGETEAKRSTDGSESGSSGTPRPRWRCAFAGAIVLLPLWRFTATRPSAPR